MAHHTPPSKSSTYNLIYADPTSGETEDYIFDICAETSHEKRHEAYGIFSQTIAGGNYAKITFVGNDQQLDAPLNYLFGKWIQSVDEKLKDAPCVIKRLKMFPEVPHHLCELEILLPLE